MDGSSRALPIRKRANSLLKDKIFVVTNNASDESHLQTKIPRGPLIVVDSPRTDLRSRRVL